MVVINISKNNKKSPTDKGNINNKLTIPIIEEVFKNQNIKDRKLILETMLLKIIRKSEFHGRSSDQFL
jgi:hypothetical protein